MRYLLILLTVLIIPATTHAQQQIDLDQSVKLYAEVQNDPPIITLRWVTDPGTTVYNLYRRDYLANESWQWIDSFPPETMQYVDVSVASQKPYEYKLVKSTSSGVDGYGYLLSGIEIPAVHQTGRLLIVLTDSTRQEIQTDLDIFQATLLADGWPNEQLTVTNAADATAVKASIVAAYGEQPFTAILLLGDVPIPHSGDIKPDGHNNHKGAWSADIYYGDLDGIWTDTLVNNTSSANFRNHNVPGDGNWDQSYLPSDVEVAVGRVDFSDMPVFAEDEYELLRQYLRKDQDYRLGLLPVRRRAMVRNSNTWSGALGQNGMRFSPLVSPDSMGYDEWNLLFQQSYQWFYAGSSGNYTVGYQLGNSGTYASQDFQSVFTAWFGSYYGDYDYPDGFMRAILGSGTVLSTAWVGAPHWYFHEMGLGYPLARATKTTQNNDTLYESGVFARGVHVNLLGDPTNKAYTFTGPTNLNVSSQLTSIDLSWTAAPEAVALYYIYVKTPEEAGFRLLDSVAADQTSYRDICPESDQDYIYLLRASRLETTPSGSFYNLSAGVTSEVARLDNYAASAGFVTTQDGNFLTLTSTSQNADSLRWLLPDGTTSPASSIGVSLSEGSSTISLIASNACSVDTFSQTFLFSFTLDPDAPEFFLYPNPAKEQITFSTPRAFSFFRLINASGKVVAQQQFSPTRQRQLSVNDFPPGLYWLNIGGQDWQLSKRLIISPSRH